MLITMLVVWAKEGFPHYISMDAGQSIAYISDIGASGLKPLFIAMSTVTVVSFDIVFILERWLRHTGRLTPNTSFWQKLYSFISVIAAIAGAVGLILLSIFDTIHHHRLHNIFLGVFIGGYIVSAIFICWEYQRLGIHYREKSVLRYSFWIKLAFIIIELALAIAFGVCGKKHMWNAGATLEWVVAFIFFFYVLSFFIDFMPAVRTKHHQSRATEMDMRNVETGDGAANGERYFRGAPANPHPTGYTNNHPNGYSHSYTTGDVSPVSEEYKPPAPVHSSQNF